MESRKDGQFTLTDSIAQTKGTKSALKL